LHDIPGAHIFNNLKDALKAAKEHSENVRDEAEAEAVIIGGGYLFRDTLSTFNKLVLTRVDCDINGDIFYPDIDLTGWNLIKTESFKKDDDNDYDFKVEEYKKL
jgi:dihydrofolate reductase